jgi:hypothetical protein
MSKESKNHSQLSDEISILAKSDAHTGMCWPCIAVWTTGVHIKHYRVKP